MNLGKENNILTTNMPSVLQILICPTKDYSMSDRCPASVEKIFAKTGRLDKHQRENILYAHFSKETTPVIRICSGYVNIFSKEGYS